MRTHLAAGRGRPRTRPQSGSFPRQQQQQQQHSSPSAAIETFIVSAAHSPTDPLTDQTLLSTGGSNSDRSTASAPLPTRSHGRSWRTRQSHTVARSLSPSSPRSTSESLSSSSLSIRQDKRRVWWRRVQTGSAAALGFVQRRVPMLAWFVGDPGYNWRGNLTQDLFAGVTISAVIIPQSMAYAMLASLPPVYGLYTSLVPTALYTLLGTSKHMSTGTFAITSLLLGQFAHKILTDQGYSEDAPNGEYHRRYLPLCLILTFFVGGIQLLLSIARLGRWSSKHLLPTALVSGFNTASALHIGTHQLKHLLGLRPPRESGVFSMLKTWVWILQHLWNETAWPSLLMGLAAMALMYILQRIEFKRRAALELPQSYVSSPFPSPATPTFSPYSPTFKHCALGPSLPSARRSSLTPSLSTPTKHHSVSHLNTAALSSGRKHWGQRRKSRAVSDRVPQTIRDVGFEDSGQSVDSCSSQEWWPNMSPTLDQGPPAIPNLRLPSLESAQHASCTNARPASPLTHGSPTPGMSGLANTGAFGRRQDRHRQRLANSSRSFRYRSMQSPSSILKVQRMRDESGDEHQPLLGHTYVPEYLSRSRQGSASAAHSDDDDEDDDDNGDHHFTYSTDPRHGIGSESRPGYNVQNSESEDTKNTGRQWKRRILRLIPGIPSVHFPIPDIFICVVVFTAATVIFNLDNLYNIKVIGFVPTGLPTPAWPLTMIESWSADDWVPLIWPSLLMAFVVYVISLSVAKHFGKEYGYEVDADQEMLALGVGSLVGSCFGAYISTGSLTRSAILAQLGAKTPLASLVGAFMVLMSLLWFTVLFERIPNTVLAAVVLVALRSLLMHAVEAKRLWRVGRRKEALIWWITFTTVIFFSIEIGLAVGMATVVVLKLYKYGTRWRRTMTRRVKRSAPYQRMMLMLGLQSPLFTTTGRGLYNGDDEDDY
ncbi:hypothetical protein BGZ98_001491 [Dissophora globulifera]|nr:hypothetical protein BGZ98_001491 [Dissophora globulifera]